MVATLRILSCAVALALLAVPAAWAAPERSGKDTCGKDILDRHGCDYTPSEFASAGSVHWNQRRVSFGNYLAFAKAEIPAPVMRTAPEFESIYFDLDKAVLKPAGIAAAKKVAAYLQGHPGDKVRIEGYCCDLASNEYNVKLGKRRAEAVKTFLVSQGIDGNRVTTSTKGESQAVHSPQQRELDRRADVIVWFLDAAR